MNPTISIIVPIYKVEQYLHNCIDSILAQTFLDFELILVNDGSPDGCGRICDEYKKTDKRVKVIHKKNGGAYSAYNAGLDVAQGEYIGIVDGDDYIDRDMYETLYRLAIEHNADVAECSLNIVSENGLSPKENHGKIEKGNHLFALKKLLEFPYLNGPCTKLYKKELFNDLRYPKKLYEDSFMAYKIYYKLNKYVFLGRGKYNYIKREDSTMGEQRNYSLNNLDGLEVQVERYNFLKQRINEPEILNMAEYHLFNQIMFHYEMLQIFKELDPQKKNREMIKNIIIQNQEAFLNNMKLKGYQKIIFASHLNLKKFDNYFKLYRLNKKYQNIVSNSKTSIKKLLT
ncbi:glycosyltransferase [Neobacillus vireti]